MRHLSPLELRVLRAVQENPRHGVEPLARVVGETVAVVRSALGVLRRFELVSRDRIVPLGYTTFEITGAGAQALREWSRRDICEQLPAGVIGIRRAQLARARRGGAQHV